MADGQTSGGCNPESKRVHVPFGTWVLSFVRFAPNDRFGPESASPPVWFRGEFYMPPQAAIKWRRQAPTSPAGTVSQPIGKPFNGQAKGLLWLTWRSYAGPPQYYIPPEGGALNPPVRRQPITGGTLGAQGQRPGGAINPHARKGVSTFGNTVPAAIGEPTADSRQPPHSHQPTGTLSKTPGTPHSLQGR